MKARRHLTFCGLFLLSCTFVLGCRNNNELLENELRVRDNKYREALEEQRAAELRVEALQREVLALRQGNAPVTPEVAAQTFGLKRITLGRSTGGYDQDPLPGDDQLQVVVEPRDMDDHVIKSPGCLFIAAIEITPQGLKTPLCSWEIGDSELRRSWKQGLLSTGYTLNLPWKKLPTTEAMRVVVQLKTPDGRVYEADKDFKVRLVAGAIQQRQELPFPPPPNAIPSPTIIPPGAMPLQEVPNLQPTSVSRYAPRSTPIPDATPTTGIQWSAAPLTGAARLGRPESLNATPVTPAGASDLRLP
jgi:hypothetical protein